MQVEMPMDKPLEEQITVEGGNSLSSDYKPEGEALASLSLGRYIVRLTGNQWIKGASSRTLWHSNASTENPGG